MLFNKVILHITISFFLISCDSESQEIENTTVGSIVVFKDATFLNQNEGIVYLDSIPLTGQSVTYYPGNTQLASSSDYIDGKRNGQEKKWFSDGTLSYQSEYINGQKNGYTISWWKNSNMRSKSNFKDGIAHGIQLQWYKDGTKFKEINLHQGKEQGIQKSWRKNGKIYNNYEAKNGRIFGLKRASLCYELEEEDIK